LKLLSKDAAQRFSTAKEASKVLAQCLAHEQDSATQLPIEFTDKPRHWRWAAIGVAIAMMGFAIFAMVQPTGPKLRLDIVPEERAEPFDPAWRTVDREIREIDQRLDALERGKPK
jgi:hypothetical protein